MNKYNFTNLVMHIESQEYDRVFYDNDNDDEKKHDPRRLNYPSLRPPSARIRARMDRQNSAGKGPSIDIHKKFEQKLENVRRALTAGRWGINIGNEVFCEKDDLVSFYSLHQVDQASGAHHTIQYIFLDSRNRQDYKEYKELLEEASKRLQMTNPAACHDFLNMMAAIRAALQAYQERATMVSSGYKPTYDYTAIRKAIEVLSGNNTENNTYAAFLLFSSTLPGSEADEKTKCARHSLLSVARGEFQSHDVEGKNFVIPYIDYVGNTEVASKHAMTESFAPDNQVRESYRRFETVKNNMPAGACTLLLSFIFFKLRSFNYPMCYLHNAADVAGCKCYSSAAQAVGYETYLLRGKEIDDVGGKLIEDLLQGKYRHIRQKSGILKISELNCEQYSKKITNEDIYAMMFALPQVMHKIIQYSIKQAKGLIASNKARTEDYPVSEEELFKYAEPYWKSDHGTSGYGEPDKGPHGYGKPDKGPYGYGKPDRKPYGKPDKGPYGYGKPDKGPYGYGKPDKGPYGYGKPDKGLHSYFTPENGIYYDLEN
jgi:hypothetical protein